MDKQVPKHTIKLDLKHKYHQKEKYFDCMTVFIHC